MIYQRQYEKVLAEAIYTHLLGGKVPNIDQVAKRVNALLNGKNKALYQYKSQPSRSVFQNNVFNKSLRYIKFDISILHEELLDLISQSGDRISYADLYHKVHITELKKLESDLESLLFTIQNADFYFLGAYDNFNDVSKIDKTISTANIIDLSETCLSLPYGGKNTKKINTSHLYEQNTWPIEIKTNTNVISSGVLSGTKFGNIFNDLTDAWAYEVITDSQAPVSIQFTFPLAGSSKEEVEVFVNRFQIISHSTNTQNLLIEVSNDNVNFLVPLGYENGLSLEDQRTIYGMDFETNLVQYVRLTLTKNSADQEIPFRNQKQYSYIFGLRNFSAYAIGRVRTARYQSLPFDFTDNEEKISKVSIEANALIFNGTNLNYSVALADDSSIITPFIPIHPINQKANTLGVNTVVLFNTTTDYSKRLTVTSSGNDSAISYGTAFQGKLFYRIGDNISPAPIFNTCALYRGFDVWYRDQTTGFQTVDIDDNYITFEHNDNESLYVLSKEIAFAENFVNNSSSRKVQLTVNNPVYYIQSRGHLLKPSDQITDTSIDIKPNYAIYKVLLNSSITRKSLSFTLSNQLNQFLPSSSFIIQSTDASLLPVLKISTGQILRPNIDYIIDTVSVAGKQKPTGTFTIPSGSALLNATGVIHTPNLLLEFTFTNDPDITYKVSSINDNFIILDDLLVNLDDSIEVHYRHIPVFPNQIIKASVRIANSPRSANSRRFYVEGTDYILDTITGLIQRVPNGNIPPQGEVYAEYTYRSADLNIQTFITWCNIDDTAGIQIKFDLNETTKKNKLVSDTSVGEGFFVNSSNGLVELTNAVNTPVLGPGWVQFVVRSKNPTTNVAFGSNLIDQVIQLRDIYRKKIFRSNNLYFKEISAIRDPMIQVTLNHLKVNTLKSDHNVFAIDNTTDPRSNYIVLNFLPNNTTELYNYIPTADSDANSRPQVNSEQFLFQWRSRSLDQAIGNKVVVRIDLERNEQTDGAITPKVFDYKIRAST